MPADRIERVCRLVHVSQVVGAALRPMWPEPATFKSAFICVDLRLQMRHFEQLNGDPLVLTK
jgi:hypothetical protein